MRSSIVAITLAVAGVLTGCRSSNERSEPSDNLTMADSIAEALDYQISNYPASQYRDVYKNFMQDFFGPGHILADTAAAGRYLRSELAGEGPFDGPVFEKTGFRGNFYRVNLSVIRDSIVPYDLFFNNFVESVRGITPLPGDEWMKIWSSVDSVITEKGYHFHEEEADRREMTEQFKRGDYVVHHSRRYNDSVHFHYRIISRDNFERNLLPLLRNQE